MPCMLPCFSHCVLLLFLVAPGCSTPRSLQHKQVYLRDTSLTQQSQTHEQIRTELHRQGDFEEVSIEFFLPDTLRVMPITGDLSACVTTSSLPALPSIKRITHTRYRSAEQLAQAQEQLHTDTLIRRGSTQSTLTDREEPAPDPYRWRYLFYTVFVALAFFIFSWLRRP